MSPTDALPREFVDALTYQLQFRLEERTPIYNAKRRERQDLFIKAGQSLNSSRLVLMTLEDFRDEALERSRTALACLAETASAYALEITPDVTAALKGILEKVVAENCEAMRTGVLSAVPLKPNPAFRKPGAGASEIAKLQKAIDRALIHRRHEVELWSRRSKNVQSSDQPSITVHGDYVNAAGSGNIIQTRAVSSTATLTFDSSVRQIIKQALDEAKRALETSADLDPKTKAETLEVISDRATEIDKPEPNLTRVKSYLSGIGGSIRTVGALDGAWKVVKGLLAQAGIDVG